MECAGNGRARLSPRPVSQPWLHEAVGTMTWTGTPLAAVLADAAPLEGAVDVVFTGADHGVEKGVEQDYQRSLSVEDASDPEVLLAWACNGVDLPPQHGYPLRLLVPGWYGMASVKWLRSVEVVDHRFDGYQMRAYSAAAEPGGGGRAADPDRAPRAGAAAGFPDFLSRRRVVRPGPQVLTGRAWSGWGEVVSVEVSVDGGTTWVAAELGAQPDRGPGARGPARGRRRRGCTSCPRGPPTRPAVRSPPSRAGTEGGSPTRHRRPSRSWWSPPTTRRVMTGPSERELAAIEKERDRIRATYLRPDGERPASSARGLHHFAVVCSDVERTVRFYQDVSSSR